MTFIESDVLSLRELSTGTCDICKPAKPIPRQALRIALDCHHKPLSQLLSAGCLSPLLLRKRFTMAQHDSTISLGAESEVTAPVRGKQLSLFAAPWQNIDRQPNKRNEPRLLQPCSTRKRSYNLGMTKASRKLFRPRGSNRKASPLSISGFLQSLRPRPIAGQSLHQPSYVMSTVCHCLLHFIPLPLTASDKACLKSSKLSDAGITSNRAKAFGALSLTCQKPCYLSRPPFLKGSFRFSITSLKPYEPHLIHEACGQTPCCQHHHPSPQHQGWSPTPLLMLNPASPTPCRPPRPGHGPSPRPESLGLPPQARQAASRKKPCESQQNILGHAPGPG